CSSEFVPAFDNSAMDGFAVRTGDCGSASPGGPVVLRIKETVRAGTLANVEIEPGEAVKIMTGAPLPLGADAVVMVEATSSEEDGIVRILQTPEIGEHIRRRGEDVRCGDLILREGTRIRPYELALLAAQGIANVSVIRKPSVSLLATGDELLEFTEPLSPGKIRNSNGPALAAALSRWGILPRYQGIVKDDRQSMREAFQKELNDSDVLLVSGGVSVGDFDYTKALLEELGLQVIFWRVAIKPGKPLLFGLLRNKLVFGLPGNPISVMVCLEEFVRPALEKMQGHTPRYPSYHLQGNLENEYRKEEARQQYIFCQVSETSEGFRVHVIRPQGSAMLGMACRANALALAPVGVKFLEKGMGVAFRWLK
ncbi:MAG: molybdopterin molybdotransferase MoeA, partial [Elusimicrobia bacterium]|nr:molybdopterin molybdotransferase MoeA [Elusimicrobiota bacterium]